MALPTLVKSFPLMVMKRDVNFARFMLKTRQCVRVSFWQSTTLRSSLAMRDAAWHRHPKSFDFISGRNTHWPPLPQQLDDYRSDQDANNITTRLFETTTAGETTMVGRSLGKCLLYSMSGFLVLQLAVDAQGDFRDEVLVDNPFLYYEFEETTGTTASDSSSSGANDGTYSEQEPGGFSLGGAGPVGLAVELDGDIGGWIDIEPTGVVTGTWTIEMIVRPTAWPTTAVRRCSRPQDIRMSGVLPAARCITTSKTTAD